MKNHIEDESVFGIAWFRKDQWESLCNVSVDVDSLEKSYEEWESFANKSIEDLISKGMHIKKIGVNVTELVDWCIKEKRPVNSESRSLFVANKLRESQIKQ
ncbi:hypothetical protein KKC91_10195 [bacterium]|nr:hypothetical protein [bacterium]